VNAVIEMIVMYPNREDARFDMDYYMNKHIPMVQEKIGAALKGCYVQKGLGGAAPGSPAPYLVICRLCFDSMDDVATHLAPHDKAFGEDVPNYTNVAPVMQLNEVVG
jgi:uncharacterized protein (TIGR02118 family)